MRLLNSFFRAQTYNPYEPPIELVFEKTTAGSFSYKIPDNARHVKIEIAGGNGGKVNFGGYAEGVGGRGGVVTILGDIIGDLAGKTVSGIVGATATSTTGQGGSGDPAGKNGTRSTAGGGSSYGGGGGGATSITIDSTEYTASGGGGATISGYFGGMWYADGGKGGGLNGGLKGDRKSLSTGIFIGNGHDATDLNINATNNGYVRIWINYSTGLLFDKVTQGEFSYTIPNYVSSISIEIAAGNGADGLYSGYAGEDDSFALAGGKGAVKIIELNQIAGETITGIIGSSGVAPSAGYPDGTNGQTKTSTTPFGEAYGGGGGGHSECTIKETTYTVSGGGGGSAKGPATAWANGGAGGGENAGAGGNQSIGGDATDGDKLNEESRGYIRIYQL